jgi:prevent-host-death family protein
MTKVDVHEVKTHLSRYLDRVEAGETVILCRHNRPIAEIRPIPPGPKRKPRVPGIDKGKITIPAAFFDPLPEDIQHIFDGEGE